VKIGVMRYYGAFYHSALHPLLLRINAYLVRWIRKKYKRLQGMKKAYRCYIDAGTGSLSDIPGCWRIEMDYFDPACLVTRMARAG
jgi:hypothetical protein